MIVSLRSSVTARLLRFLFVVACVVLFGGAAGMASAAETEQSAYTSCESHVQTALDNFIAAHGAQYAQGMRCARVTVLPDQAWEFQGSIYVDIYHTGNFQWYLQWTIGYGIDTFDKVKSCGGACPNQGRTPLLRGNPIDVVTGAKIQQDVDLASVGGQSSLSFSRAYLGDTVDRPLSMLGGRWRSNYDRRITVMTYAVPGGVIAYREGGTGIYFNDDGTGNFKSDSDIPYKLVKLFSGSTHIGWSLTDDQDRVETYNAAGLLTKIEWPNGNYQTLGYDVYSRLASVTARDGRSLTFAYDTLNRLQAMTDPSGATTTYAYDSGSGLLGTVTYPGGATKQYLYNETGYVVSPSPGTFYLTGIQDESTQRYASFTYDSSNRAIESTHAGDADKVSITYGAPGGVAVTDALGQSTTIGWQESQRTAKFTSASSLSVSSGSTVASMTYDAAGYPNTSMDFRGSQIDRDFNARGLETQRIEAANDTYGDKRTTQTDWNATFRQPDERRVLDSTGALKAKTNWTYNSRGQVLTITRTDPSVTPNVTRTTTYTYCEAADITAGMCPLLGLLTSVNGPRTDVSDVTTYTYRMADEATCASSPATCPYRKGDLWKITNAAGQIAETVKYDGSGRPLQVKDVNGIVTDFEYHARGWLTARKVRGTNDAVETDDLITSLEYWPTGLVKKVTQPDGGFTSYTYDAAQRLTGISDNAGNSITYTLNAAGQRTKEETKDSTAALRRTLSRTYNTLGQLQTQTDALNRDTSFTYDANGNLDQTTDALTRIADNNYDPLNRLSRTLQDMSGIAAETQFTYDALDNLVKVNDPKLLDTTYTYNGFSDLKQLVSPDTGTTTYTYDSAGNRASQTDARSKVANYTYDALNRLTGISYPTASTLNTTYTWDTTQAACLTGETFTAGRLVKIVDGSGNTVYCYDRFGHVVRKVQTTNAVAFTLRYTWNAAGQLTSTIYPDGAVVDYVYDTQGRVSEIGAKTSTGTRQVLLTNVSYYPFGPAASWRYGSSTGRLLNRTRNQNYQPGIVQDTTTGGLSLGYEFDEVGNLKKLRDGNQSEPPQRIYGYDGLNRLTQTQDGNTSAVLQGYTYDSTGNRTSATVSGTTTTYTYPSTSHRLSQVGTSTRAYDFNGNTTSVPAGAITKNFVYGDHNRMTQYKEGTTVKMNYVYNGRGEQVRKYLSTTNTYTLYDEAGHWIGNYANAGATAPTQQAIWFGDLPVGLFTGAGASQKVFYIQPDALGTPRLVIDPTRGANGTTVWKWDLVGEAFGTTAPNQDPDGDATPFVFDLRFPGQRYDSASGLNYNYFRDYEAATARYVESDPIGLKGGISLYGYASGNPLTRNDAHGMAHTSGFFDAQREAQVLVALADAREKIRKCDMGKCYEGLDPYYMTESDRQYIIEKLNTMRIVYKPDLPVCGHSPQFQSSYIEIGPVTFSGACCLSATLAHEANHLGRNWGGGRGANEERPEYIEKKCFGCGANFGAPR